MEIRYNGTNDKDKKSRKYKCLKMIDKHYGCLSNFLYDLELQLTVKK